MHERAEEWVRRRAYALWEAEGRPSNRSLAHWRQAEEEAARRGFYGLTEEGCPIPPPQTAGACKPRRHTSA